MPDILRRLSQSLARDLAETLGVQSDEAAEKYNQLPEERQDEIIDRILEKRGLELPESEGVYIELRKGFHNLIAYIENEKGADEITLPVTATLESCGLPSRKQVERKVLRAFRQASGSRASLDSQVSQVIGGDFEDVTFLSYLQKEFPQLTDEDCSSIEQIYYVQSDDMYGGDLGLNLGRKSASDGTFNDIVTYIIIHGQHPAQNREPAIAG